MVLTILQNLHYYNSDTNNIINTNNKKKDKIVFIPIFQLYVFYNFMLQLLQIIWKT